GSREKGRATPFGNGDSPLATVVASGSPVSVRWGRKEFGWSQRRGQHTQVVGGYAFCPIRSRSMPRKFPWGGEFPERRNRVRPTGRAGVNRRARRRRSRARTRRGGAAPKRGRNPAAPGPRL